MQRSVRGCRLSTTSTPLSDSTACLIAAAIAPVGSSPATVTSTLSLPAGTAPLAGQVSNPFLGSGRAEIRSAVNCAWRQLVQPLGIEFSAVTPSVFCTSGDHTAIPGFTVVFGRFGASARPSAGRARPVRTHDHSNHQHNTNPPQKTHSSHASSHFTTSTKTQKPSREPP